MIVEFVNDEATYRSWLVEHTDGYLINCYLQPTPDYLWLHRATCGHINSLKHKNYTTGDFKKVCSTSRQELEDWAVTMVGSSLALCRCCKLTENTDLPFATYPGNGNELLPLARGETCRHGYGLNHQRITGQMSCGYCGRDFTASYDTWLMMALDHVIPAKVCEAMNLRAEWMNSHSNRVLCCSACNGFKNRWKPEVPPACPTTLDEFFAMRNAMFIDRRTHVLLSHINERCYFDSKPWE